MEFEYKEEYRYPTSLCLNVTDACNLACRYCFVEQHPHYMTLDIAKEAIKWIINNKKIRNQKYGYKVKKNSVTFFGGEPTLMWDTIIVPLILWTEQEYPNEVNFSITTNGTLLNKERIEFLYKHDIKPLLSIDGNKITQDYNRPCHNNNSSFDLVSQNFQLILKYFPKTTFRSTIIPETADQLFNNYIFALTTGFQNYYMMPNERQEWTQENKEKLEIEIKKIYSFLTCCFEKNFIPKMDCSVIDHAFEKVIGVEKNKINNRDYRLVKKPVMRCGLGTTSVSVGYDGSIYGCQEQPSKENNIFYLGNILTNQIEKERHKKLLNLFYNTINEKCINEKYCLTCPLQIACTATTCPSASFDYFQTFSYASEISCFWQQILFKYSNNLLRNIDINNQTFSYYLQHYTKLEKYLRKGDDN